MTLTVLISTACGTCLTSLAIARAFSLERPDVPVRVQDVDVPGWQAPAGYVGTPMFLADDRVLSYGNPTREQLAAAFPRGKEHHDEH